jgi:predicted transcriptional regulator
LTQDIRTDIRRDKLDIILRILEVGNAPVKKTHILYKAGINFYQLTRYLDLLLKTGMMEETKDPYVAYRTTEKGRVLMNLFNSNEVQATVSNSAGRIGTLQSVKSARQDLGPAAFF